MKIDNLFNIGDMVYLKTDIEQKMRLVGGINIRPGTIIYLLCLDQNVSEHYGFEMTNEKNVLISTGIE